MYLFNTKRKVFDKLALYVGTSTTKYTMKDKVHDEKSQKYSMVLVHSNHFKIVVLFLFNFSTFKLSFIPINTNPIIHLTTFKIHFIK